MSHADTKTTGDAGKHFGGEKMNLFEKGEPLDGVACDVKTCSYHNSGDRCVANRIRIANENSNISSDTFCGTFKKK